MSKLVEKMRREFMTKQMRLLMEHGGVAGDDIQDSFMDRYLRAALAVVMAEMREPSEGMMREAHGIAYYGGAIEEQWAAMLAQFEKEQAGG